MAFDCALLYPARYAKKNTAVTKVNWDRIKKKDFIRVSPLFFPFRNIPSAELS
jgi:hypothetical protein